MRAIILAAAFLAAPAVANDAQFDLVCSAKKDVVRYRVDLTRGQWCDGDCSLVRNIVEANDGLLTLERQTGQRPGDRELSTTINRVTGGWRVYELDPQLDAAPFTQVGSCDPAPFSGFPTRRF